MEQSWWAIDFELPPFVVSCSSLSVVVQQGLDKDKSRAMGFFLNKMHGMKSRKFKKQMGIRNTSSYHGETFFGGKNNFSLKKTFQFRPRNNVVHRVSLKKWFEELTCPGDMESQPLLQERWDFHDHHSAPMETYWPRSIHKKLLHREMKVNCDCIDIINDSNGKM